MVDALASSTSAALAPAIIAAIASIISALLLGWIALRAQSATRQLEEIRKVVDERSDVIEARIEAEMHKILDAPTRGLYIADACRRAVRDVLREQGHWPQPGPGRRHDED